MVFLCHLSQESNRYYLLHFVICCCMWNMTVIKNMQRKQPNKKKEISTLTKSDLGNNLVLSKLAKKKGT